MGLSNSSVFIVQKNHKVSNVVNVYQYQFWDRHCHCQTQNGRKLLRNSCQWFLVCPWDLDSSHLASGYQSNDDVKIQIGSERRHYRKDELL